MLSRYAKFTTSAPLNLTSNLCQFLNSSNAPQLIAFLDLQAAKVDKYFWNPSLINIFIYVH